MRVLQSGGRSGHIVCVKNLDVRNQKVAEGGFDDTIILTDEVDGGNIDGNFVKVSCSVKIDAFDKLVVVVIDEDRHGNTVVDVG